MKTKIILNTVKKHKQNTPKSHLSHNHTHPPQFKIITKNQSQSIPQDHSLHHSTSSKTLQFTQSYPNTSQQHSYPSIQHTDPKWSIGDFQVLQQLGHGKFGQVYAARELQSDFIVALKKMSRKELQENNFQKQIKREIIIQSSLKHENILKMFGYFWDEQAIYLILEYAPGGQLYGLLKKYKSFSEKNVSVIIRQVLEALKYLHFNSIIHRDIKPQNLLLSLGSVKLADFGWSIHSDRRRDTLCGTLDYLAPQMVKGSTHDSSIDIWEVGVLAYQLAVGNPPFETNSYNETYNKIINSDVVFPGNISYELRRFIRSCLQKKPEKRPKVQECLGEDFIMNYINQEIQFDNE